MHIDKKKDILIIGLGPTQVLDGTTLIAGTQHSSNFLRSNKKFCLRLHYNGSNIATKIHQFKAKDLEIKKELLCLGKISGDFSSNKHEKKKTGLNGCVYDIFVDYKTFKTSNIIDVHKY